tara:strand:- start:320 stop:496 length:177 start_codon:yes stop_codon:yes gene_type:complete
MPIYTQIVSATETKSARKNAPATPSQRGTMDRGKSAPKTKRGYKKKKMEYWNNRKKKK